MASLPPPGGLLFDYGGNLGTGIVVRDGTNLITASDSGIFRTWDLRSGRLHQGDRPGGFGSNLHLVLSPDGTRMLTTDVVITARLWDIATGGLSDHPLETMSDRPVPALLALTAR